jgi:membrane protein implicated in regulation of membrane protease activity
MHDLFFAGNAGWFTVPAIVGSVFFVARLALMLIGVGDGHGMIDADHGAGGAEHSDSDHAFKVLSIQGIAAFMMGFGWGGLGGLKGSGWSWNVSLLCAIVAGVAFVWLLGLLLKAVHDLQSSGNIAIESAVGVEGSVYARIPAHRQGSGQVKVVVKNHQRIYNAVSDGDVLDSNTSVRVTNVNADNTLTVTRV